MERDDAPVALVGVNAQRDLLDHRAARHENGRGLVEKRADLFLQDANGAAFAIEIDRQIVRAQRGDLRERLGWRPQAMSAQRSVTGFAQAAPFGRGKLV